MGHTLKYLTIALVASLSIPAHAQTRDGNIVLPTVASAKNGYCTVCSIWKPTKKFLKHNSDFLKDGSYAMSGKYINKGHYNKHMGYRNIRLFHMVVPDHTEFTSAQYPAISISSTKKINTNGSVYIQVVRTERSQTKFPLGKGQKARKKKNTGFVPDHYYAVSDPLLKNAYNNLNNYYKQKAKEIADQKFVNPVYISDIGASNIDSAAYGMNDLFFQFEYVEAQSVNDHFLAPNIVAYSFGMAFFIPWNYPLLFTKRNSSEIYPSNLLLKLHVKNIAGKEIKTYSQVVFVKERHLVSWASNDPIAAKALIFKQALPVAMENLINQFTEDTATIGKINKRNQKINELAAQHPALASCLSRQTRLDQINDSKKMIEESLNETSNQLSYLGVPASFSITPTSPINIPPNANLGLAALVVVGIAAMDIAIEAMVKSTDKHVRYTKATVLQTQYQVLTLVYGHLQKEEEKIRNKPDEFQNSQVLVNEFRDKDTYQ